jgi:hypothetical protein
MASVDAAAAAISGRPYLEDDDGRGLRAAVEYAPYQKVPRGKPRRDRREGTIEKDPEFQVREVFPLVASLDGRLPTQCSRTVRVDPSPLPLAWRLFSAKLKPSSRPRAVIFSARARL